MTPLRRTASQRFLGGYRLWVRARAKAFSVLAGGSFEAFGARSVVQTPVRIEGEGRMRVGSDVFIGSDCWLHVVGEAEGPVALVLGDGVSIVGHCVLSAAQSVRLGERVLLARGVYISDHSHGRRDPDRAVLDQGVDDIAPVVIGDGAWLGENVVVCPGVTIGARAVVGANSVVTKDVPSGAVAVGAPARVVGAAAPATR